MSREIKFRAWDSYQKIMFYDCDTIRIGLNGLIYFGRDWDGNMTEITTPLLKLMQYTGLKDKNGKEIYEGDVIKTPSGMVWLVEPMNSEEKDRNKWGLCVSLNGCGTNYFIDKSILKGEIIGDIYSTPELLKEPIQ